MAVVHILTSLVSRSPELMQELRRLWYVLDAADIELRPLYIRSAQNVIADWASRLAFSGDYMLRPSAAARLQATWGVCTVDAFASPASALLPRYWTPGLIAGCGCGRFSSLLLRHICCAASASRRGVRDVRRSFVEPVLGEISEASLSGSGRNAPDAQRQTRKPSLALGGLTATTRNRPKFW